VLFHYFERFFAEYEGRFEKEYGYLQLTFAAEKQPPYHVLCEIALTAAEESGEYE
jgi:hypothetical protein